MAEDFDRLGQNPDKLLGEVGNKIGSAPINPNKEVIPDAAPKKQSFGSLRFPLNIGALSSQNYPHVTFKIVTFRDRWAILEKPGSSAAITNSLTFGFAPSNAPAQTEILGWINLPLPQDVQNAIIPQWNIADSPVIGAVEDLWKSGDWSRLMSNAGALFAGPYNQKIRFQTANPKKQAFFGGIEPRQFTFNYTFSPQDEKEAAEIERIIRAFTVYSLPTLSGPLDAFFDFPCEYFIEFKNVSGFPLMKQSLVCTSVSTNYSASAMQLLKSGHTVQIGLSLTFTETTIRTSAIQEYNMAEYFSGFPKIVYDGRQIKDITIRLDFLRRIKDNISIFQYVQIRHGQRPEDIANVYYNDPTLYWIVLYMNDIVDPYLDWLLTDDQVYQLALSKYESINAVHHYETTSSSPLGAGVIVDFWADFKVPVTNLTYEQTQNELKRKIKILKLEYIPQVLSEYQSELRK